MDRTDISIKITSIENDLELLKNGHIHELEKVPGVNNGHSEHTARPN